MARFCIVERCLDATKLNLDNYEMDININDYWITYGSY